MKLIRCLITGVGMILLCFCANAQTTRVVGQVTDAASGEPIPFANVYFKNINVGASTDFDGKYVIETREAGDSLMASYVGYYSQTRKIKANQYQQVDFQLQASQVSLSEIVIEAGENPAIELLQKIIERKEQNSIQDYEYVQYEFYNKIEFDANNITEKLKERKILKPFQFVFDYADTSVMDGKVYLPVFISEVLSDIYVHAASQTTVEEIKATRLSGIDNQSIAQYMSNVDQKINIYDNYISIFQKNFVSPIADFGLNTYEYYLIDSSWFGNQWCYEIMFKPKRKQELTFTGSAWIHDSTYAVKSFKMRMASDANINFVNAFNIEQDFDFLDNRYWMLSREKVVVDFNIFENAENLVGFFGHKNASYRDYQFNKALAEKFYKRPVKTVVLNDSESKSDAYWQAHRHESLTQKEAAIYEMIDSVKQLPLFKTYVDIAYMLTVGYYDAGKIELGPVYKLYSFNEVEGNRFRFGFQTNDHFNKKIQLNAYLAYGTKDQRFKYGGGFLYLISKNPRRVVAADVKYDIEQLGASFNSFGTDNILSALLRRRPADRLSLVRDYSLYYEHEWFTGLINTPSFIHRTLYPVGNYDFTVYDDAGEPTNLNQLVTSEFRLDTRLAIQEKIIIWHFQRRTIATKYPIVLLRYGYGVPNFLGSDYEYHRLQLGLKHWFNVFSIGWSSYIVQAGRIFGTLPFPLLHLHPGNESFVFDEFSYNLMNFFEFVSDQYASLYYSHHFDGLLFNHIPGIRKLKWREVAFVQGVIGSMSQINLDYNQLPSEFTYTLDKPYIEAGVGIENIFKIVRIDAIWRLTQLEHPNVNKFGVFVSLQFSF